MHFHAYSNASDFETLGTFTDPLPEYQESIETASEDDLRCWLIKNGYTNLELTNMIDAGYSLQDIASDLHTDEGLTSQ